MNTKTILTALIIILMSVTAMAQKTELKAGETLQPGDALYSKDGKWVLTARFGQFSTFATNNFSFDKIDKNRTPKVKIGKATGMTQKLILTSNSINVNECKSGGLIWGESQGSPTFKYTKLIVENDGSVSIYGSDGKTQIQMKHIK